MMGKYQLSDFNPEYIESLKAQLLPTLKKYSGWIAINDLTDNPELFVNAVVALAERGYMDDMSGFVRIELSHGEESIRYVTDREINELIDIRLLFKNIQNYEKDLHFR